MAQGFVRTVNRNGRWENTIEGDDGAVSASQETKALRRKTEHVIHRADGSIEERDSYGNDPRHGPG